MSHVRLSTDITKGENLAESLVAEGLAQVRRENLRESAARLVELEDTAKAAGKGKWAPDASVSPSSPISHRVGQNVVDGEMASQEFGLNGVANR